MHKGRYLYLRRNDSAEYSFFKSMWFKFFDLNVGISDKFETQKMYMFLNFELNVKWAVTYIFGFAINCQIKI